MLVWLGPLAIGLSLGLLGGGGSILTVPLLVYGFGLETKTAMATSLLVVGVTSAVAAIPHLYKGHVCPRVGTVFGLAGMLGAYAGGSAARLVPGEALFALFVLVMLATAFAMLRGRSQDEDLATAPSSPCDRAEALPKGRILLHGLLVGGATGLVGAGGGFLVVPALHLLGGLPMHAAIGSSVLVIAMQSLAGFAAYAQHVAVDYSLAAPIMLLAAVGTLFGGLLAGRWSGTRLKRGFGVFILAIAGYTLYRETPWEWPERHPLWLTWKTYVAHDAPIWWGWLEHHPLWLIGLGIGIAASVTWIAVKKRRRRLDPSRLKTSA